MVGETIYMVGRLPFNGWRPFNSVGGLGVVVNPPAGPVQHPGEG